jgi:hypothetical protein
MIIEEGFDFIINDMNYGNDSNNLIKFKERDSVEVNLGRIFYYTEFDETIDFYHSFDILRKFRFEPKGKDTAFPLLTNNEFIFAGLSTQSIESDKDFLINLDRKELLPTVMTRVKQFAVTNDANFRVLFLENLSSYAEKIGLESCIDLIMPVLTRIVYFN